MDIPLGTEEEALAQPTRARIFTFLVERRSAATTEEIARALELHPNGVRRHLDRLAAAGLLERRRARGQRGRPSDLWRIAAGARPGGERPQGYAELASWLARAIPARPGEEADVEETGREIGRELAPTDVEDPVEAFAEVISALGFQPVIDLKTDGSFTCELANCPYRDSVRGNAEVICTLHRGITAGLLSQIAPDAKLARFEPHDPEHAGCLVGVSSGDGD